MGKYKVAVINEPNSKFSIEEREIPTPKAGEVLVKVAACGICHSDKFTTTGGYPGMDLPRVPGHEVVGHVEAVGESVEWPTVGMYVGVGWHGNHCMFCEQCRRGDFNMCPNSKVTGIHFDGGYAEYMIVHWTGVAEMPEGLDPVAAAPLLCAGITTFNAIRNQDHLVPGDLVAIQGIGGLGHLGIQFAKKMGYRVAAVSTSDRKRELAEKLGADYYIDTSKEPASAQLKALGGAKLAVATAPNSKSMADLVNGLGARGRLLIVGADAATLEVSPLQLIPMCSHVCGWAAGIATDSTDTCRFAESQGIESMNEVFTLDQAQEAFDHMMSGKARFRCVIKM